MKNLVKIIATTVLGVTMLGCKHKDCVKPVTNNCSGIKGETITVKVDEAMCGYGAWGSLWLKPTDDKNKKCENGSHTDWLQPYSIEAGINFTPKKGETISITYRKVAKDNRYDSMAICKAYPGTSTPIHILCVKSDTTKTDTIN
jgi:hypothetical protein